MIVLPMSRLEEWTMAKQACVSMRRAVKLHGVDRLRKAMRLSKVYMSVSSRP